ncbi:hypothetical protein [Brumimicrobium oceani]|uniref:Right handed beta helix domain-containing protein n=1 Tax=Brumimicrobium oceani TaxID=2100725 RepID=A0A2U2XA87_9FLAO|nr:hypothetical protein [Brumimicrobium oceani]PWH84631.1 hypothetical protein DIT68_12965 [Brumimicrobium oceani]
MVHLKLKTTALIVSAILIGVTSCKKDEVEPTPTNPGPSGSDPATVLDCNYFNEDRVLVDNPNASVDYIVTCKIDIQGDIVIEPGVVIEFEQDAGFNVLTSLSAVGTAEKPIIFRGVENDPGFWRGVKYNSSNTLNELNYVHVHDAGGLAMGGNGEKAGVVLYGGSKLKMDNCLVTNSETHGLDASYQTSNLTSFKNNVFKNNNIPIKISLNQIDAIHESNKCKDNAKDFILVNTVHMKKANTWKKSDVKYRTNGDISLYELLTINPGVEIEMYQASKINVGSEGGLVAVGTAEDPIILTGVSKVPKAWQGIYINSPHPENEIAHVEFHYCGYGEPETNVWLWYNKTLNIHDVSFENGDGCGVNYKLHFGQAENQNLTIGSNITVDPGGCVSAEW